MRSGAVHFNFSVARAIAIVSVSIFVWLFVACSGETDCIDSGHKCRTRGNWQVCTTSDSGGFCRVRYYIAPDGYQVNCTSCNCDVAQFTMASYCEGPETLDAAIDLPSDSGSVDGRAVDSGATDGQSQDAPADAQSD